MLEVKNTVTNEECLLGLIGRLKMVKGQISEPEGQQKFLKLKEREKKKFLRMETEHPRTMTQYPKV